MEEDENVVNYIYEAKPEKFKELVKIAKEKLEHYDCHAEFLIDRENYDDCKCYYALGGRCGFAITKDRELISLFNISNIKILHEKVIVDWIKQEADWLTCLGYYDIRDIDCGDNSFVKKTESLVYYYAERLGFKLYCRTSEKLEDMTKTFGKEKTIKFIEKYGIPCNFFMINPKYDVKKLKEPFIYDYYKTRELIIEGIKEQRETIFTEEASECDSAFPYNLFMSRLQKIIAYDNTLDDTIDSYIEHNPLLCDAAGVRAPFLSHEIIEHLTTLFLAVNPSISEKTMFDFVEYYVYENNYGGTMRIGDVVYHLDYEKELYDYIRSMKDEKERNQEDAKSE